MSTKIRFLAFKERGELVIESRKLRMGVKVPLSPDEVRALVIAMEAALVVWDGNGERKIAYVAGVVVGASYGSAELAPGPGRQED